MTTEVLLIAAGIGALIVFIWREKTIVNLRAESRADRRTIANKDARIGDLEGQVQTQKETFRATNEEQGAAVNQIGFLNAFLLSQMAAVQKNLGDWKTFAHDMKPKLKTAAVECAKLEVYNADLTRVVGIKDSRIAALLAILAKYENEKQQDELIQRLLELLRKTVPLAA